MFPQSLSASRWAQRVPQPPRSHTTTSNERNGLDKPLTPNATPSQESNPNPPPSSTSAPNAATANAVSGPNAARESDLAKLSRLLARLQWKAHHLLVSLENSHLFSASTAGQATSEPASSAQQDHAHPHPPPSSISGAAMFKLDFYEYYNLLERALVGFLAFYHVPTTPTALHHDDEAVTAENRAAGAIIGDHVLPRGLPRSAGGAGPENNGSNAKGATISTADTQAQPGAAEVAQQARQNAGRSRIQRVFGAASHRYHANVLDAFSLVANPLRDVLGAGTDAGEQLRRAKDLRNRWKEVEALPADALDGRASAGVGVGAAGSTLGGGGGQGSASNSAANGTATATAGAKANAAQGSTADTAAAARVQSFFANADDLRSLLSTILAALEQALTRARADAEAPSAQQDEGMQGSDGPGSGRQRREQHQHQHQQQILVTRTGAGTGAGGGAGCGGGDEDIVMEDAPWEAVADAMAWEYM